MTLLLERVQAPSTFSATAPVERDTNWFTQVYERTFDRAYRFALMLTHDHHLAEDVVAESFSKVWQRRSEFLGESELSWVLAIVRNRAVDTFRARRQAVTLDAIPEPEDDTEPALEELTAEQLNLLRSCVRRLTTEQQQVVFLRFYEGLPHDAVARRLGKNPNAIRAIQFRALARLRTLLEEAHVRS